MANRIGLLSEAIAAFQRASSLRPNLEGKIGFRFESTNGWNEAYGRASNYAFDSGGVIETNPVVGHSALSPNRARFLPAT